MFTKRHPSEGRPNGRTAPKGTVKGKTPSRGGHPVRGKGTRNAPTRSSTGTSRYNTSPSRRGSGGRSSGVASKGANY